MDAQIQLLFDQKHRLTPQQVAKLEDRHRRQLVRMVKGTTAAPDRTVAMDALVRIAPASARRALGEVILDRTTPLHLRAVAATQLGRVGGPAAEAKLIESLRVERAPIFRIKVAAALGKIGGSNSVATLKRMATRRQPPAVRRQAKLGLVLIGFRKHDKGAVPPIVDKERLLPPRADREIRFKASPAARKLLGTTLRDIRLDSYGVELSEKTGIRFECGRNRLVMLLNAGIADHDILRQLKRPTIAGLIAQQASTDASWATRYLLVSWPTDDGSVQLNGYRTDGYHVLAGTIAFDRDRGVLEVVAVRDGANTPTRLRGSIRGKKISFTELTTEAIVVGKRFLTEAGIPDVPR